MMSYEEYRKKIINLLPGTIFKSADAKEFVEESLKELAKIKSNKNIEYYVIYVIPSEYSGYEPKYISSTLEDAENHIMDFSNWYCPKGTCQIRKVDSCLKTLEIREYNNGKLQHLEIQETVA